MIPKQSYNSDPFEQWADSKRQQTKNAQKSDSTPISGGDDYFENYIRTGAVKKKQDGDSSVNTGNISSGLGSQLVSISNQIEKKSPITFLSEDIDDSQYFKDSAKPFTFESLTEPKIAPAGEAGDIAVKKQKQKEDILTKPQALQDYAKSRITALKSSISDLQKQLYSETMPSTLQMGIPTYGYTGQTYTDGGKQLAKEIEAKKNYLKDFQDNLSKVADDVVIKNNDIRNLDDNKIEDLAVQKNRIIGKTDVDDDQKVLQTIGKEVPAGSTLQMGIPSYNPVNFTRTVGGSQQDIYRTTQGIHYGRYREGTEILSNYFANKAKELEGKAKNNLEALADVNSKLNTPLSENDRDALQSFKDNIMKDNDVQAYFSYVDAALDYAKKTKTAVDKFPQVKRQQMRQNLNDIYFNKLVSKDVKGSLIPGNPMPILRWLFGETAGEKDVKDLAKESGYSEDEVRDIINQSTQGFFSGKDNAGVRVPGGIQAIAQGMDETIADIVIGANRFLNGGNQNTEAENRALSDRLSDYNMRAQRAKLYDDAGKLNFNPYSLFNEMGRGIGQTSIYGAPSLVISGLGAGIAEGLGATVKKANIIGKVLSGFTTVGTGFAGAYEQAYKEAAKYTNDESVRRAYAFKVALANGGAEVILEPAEVLQKIGIGKINQEKTFKAFAKNYKEGGAGKAIWDGLKEGFKEGAKVIAAENFEEHLTNIATDIAKKSDLGVETSPSDFMNETIQTAIQTAVTTLPLGIGAGISGFKDQSNIYKHSLFEAGNEPQLTIEGLKKWRDDGMLTQDQYNERVSVVNTMSDIVSKIKDKDVNGNRLSYNQKARLAAEQFRILNNKRIAESGATIEAEKPIIEADTKEAIKNQTDIINGVTTESPTEEDAAEFDVQVPESAKNALIEKIKSIDSKNTMVKQAQENHEDGIAFIQYQATGMASDRADAGKPSYNGTVEMFGEDIVHHAVSMLPQDTKDMILRSWREKGIEAPAPLLDALQSTPGEIKTNVKKDNEEKSLVADTKENTTTIKDVIDKPVTYKGKSATILQDGQTIIAKINGENVEYELGNVNNISDKNISDFNVELQQSKVSINDDGEITVRGVVYKNNFSKPKSAINYDKDGNVISVNLENEKGQKITFNGNIAEDIAYQIELKEISKNNETLQQFEDFVEQDDEAKQQILSGYDEAVANESSERNNEEVQGKPTERRQHEPKIEDERESEWQKEQADIESNDKLTPEEKEKAKVESTAKALEGVKEFKAESDRYFEYVPIEEIEKYKEFDRATEKKWGSVDNTLEELVADIQKNGIKTPITLQVDRNNNALVVEGNTRLAAAKKLGIKNIPVRIISGEFGSINKDKTKKLGRKRDIGEMNVFYPYVNILNQENSPAKFGFTSITNTKNISEAYHKAKEDGSNPELVKAVEELLNQGTTPKPASPVSGEGKVENNQNNERLQNSKENNQNEKATVNQVDTEQNVHSSASKPTETIEGYEFTKTPSLTKEDGLVVKRYSKEDAEMFAENDLFVDSKTKNTLKSGASYEGNGWYGVKGENGSMFLYSPETKELVEIDHKKGGRVPVAVQNFIENNQRRNDKPTEAVPTKIIEQQVQDFGVSKEMAKPVTTMIEKVFDGLKKSGLVVQETLQDWVGIGKAEKADPNSLDGVVAEIQKDLPKTEKAENKLQSWIDKWKELKKQNDLEQLDLFYNKVKVALNGYAQGKGVVKEFEQLKSEIEEYAAQLKTGANPKVSPKIETDTNKQPINKLEDLQDVGEKIGGAKKDLAQSLSEVTRSDIESKPLSQVFPRPDFKKLVEEGSLTQDAAILLNFIYDNIPTKPRKAYRVASWVRTVEGAIGTAQKILEAESLKNSDFSKKVQDAVTLSETLKRDYNIYSETLKGLGFPNENVNLGGYKIKVFENRNKLNKETGKLERTNETTYSIVNNVSIIGDFKSMDDAINGLKKILSSESGKTKGTKFDIYQDRKTGSYFIGKKGAVNVVRVVEGFKTLGEARGFLKDKQSDLQNMWDRMKAPKERRMANRPRVGADWRKGKNITSEEFKDTFGFRGVEFGNWVNNAERQAHVNEAYDSLMDLASVLGISPKALSLNGELGFAFGARGSGKANAHYEAGKVVINLTKTRGAGSLAHEWWHALDNYFSRARGEKGNFITDTPRNLINRDGSIKSGVRNEMIDAFKTVMDAIGQTKLRERSKELDKTRSDLYWSTAVEMSARSFENYIIEKLGEKNQQNDYLANFKETSEWITDTKGDLDALKNYPYPLAEESQIVNEKFQQFFETIKEDEKGKLFNESNAQYRIESGKNIIEAIKDFNGSPRAVVALTHEIMHPTVVSIIDGAKEGNEVGLKHTKTIVEEFNKANPENKVTEQELIEGNDAFINGKTTKKYRAVQEFIANSAEKYFHEGAKGFSKAFQEVLDLIRDAFRSVYGAAAKEGTLTPELRQMFDEILGKENQSEATIGDVNKPGTKQKQKVKITSVKQFEDELKNIFALDNLLNIKKIANAIKAGTSIFKRFSQAEQRGLTEGGTTNVEASVILGGKSIADKSFANSNEAQEEEIESYAKENGIWYDNPTEQLTKEYGEPIGAGEEAIVWNDGEQVVKSQNTLMYGTLQEKLDGITLQNTLFPESKVEVIGFGRNEDGDFQIIVRQPFIEGGETKVTRQEIDKYFTDLGFKKDENDNYSNGDIIIEDVHTGNAVKTHNGNIVVIDPIMRLNTPQQGYGGNRKVDNSIDSASLDKISDAISFLKNTDYIETGETKEEDGEVLKKAYKPIYTVGWYWADNTDPQTEDFENIDDAFDDAQEAGDYDRVDDYYEPYKEVSVNFREVWLDENGDIYEEGEKIYYDDFASDNPSSYLVKLMGKYSEPLDIVSFEKPEESADELEYDVYNGINKKIEGDIIVDGVPLSVSVGRASKYRDIIVYDKENNEVGRIVLRISNHTYNPSRNTKGNDFISVEINNRDRGRYYPGMRQLRFTGDNTFEEVVEAVKNRMEEIISGWNIAPTDKISSIKTGQKNNTIAQYLEKAKAVLNQLYPDATITTYDTDAEYREKEGRPVGSMGAFHPSEKRLALNLELIAKHGEENTIFHEVIHPIVNDAILSKEGALDSAWEKLKELKDVPGMQSVFDHIQAYAGRGANIQKIEGVTEFLTQVADGKIDLNEVPKSAATKIIDLINKIFEALGISKRISTADDIQRLAESIKTAFDTSDATAIKRAMGQSAKSGNNVSLDALNSEEQEKAIRDLINRSEGVSTDKLKELIKKYTGWDDAKVDGMFPERETGIKHEKTKETAREFGFPEYEKDEVQTLAQWDKEAVDLIKSGYNISSLISKLESGNHIPSAIEQRILAKYLEGLEFDVEKNPSDENIDKLIRAIKASDVAGGRETARSLVARKGLGVRDNSLAGFFIEQDEANIGAPMTQYQKNKNEEEYRDIKEAQLKYEQKIISLEKENSILRAEKEVANQKRSVGKPKKSHEDYVAERKDILKNIREKLKSARTGESGLTAVPVPYAKELIAIAPDVIKLTKSLIEEGVTSLADIVKYIHTNIKDDFKQFTEKDIHDIIAGDYNKEVPTKKVLVKTLQDIRYKAKLVSKLDALNSGKEPSSESRKQQRNREISELQKKIKEHDLTKLSQYKKQLNERIKAIEADLNTGNYQEPKQIKLPIRLDKEAIELKDKLIKLKQQRDIRLDKEKYQARGNRQKIKDRILEVSNVPRTIMSSMDYSAPFRQALIPTVSHPGMAAKAGIEMFRMSFSEKRFDRWFYDLKESNRYPLMKEVGLYVADPHDPRLSAKEEAFMNNLAERIPIIGRLIRGSERAYVGYLNKMRVDLFNRMADALEDQGITYENNSNVYKSFASWINNATGRGGLGTKLENASPVLNSIFFSPRLIASRFNILGLSDIATLGKGLYGNMPKEVRIEAAKDMIKFVGTGLTLLGLLALAFGGDDDDSLKVGTDPRSSDFGKIISGNTRWDIWGGFQQYARLISQMATGQKVSTTGKVSDLSGTGMFGESRGDVLSRFVRGKLAPVPSMIVDFTMGRTISGEKVSVEDQIKQHFAPLFYSDLKDAFKDRGVSALFLVGIPSTFGVGVQTYNPRGYESVNHKSGLYKTLFDKNLNLPEINQGDMSDNEFKKFSIVKERIFNNEWDNVIKYGAMLNEYGNPTLDENKGVATKPFNELTKDELSTIMKSISNRSRRLAEKEIGYEKPKEKKNQEYIK